MGGQYTAIVTVTDVIFYRDADVAIGFSAPPTQATLRYFGVTFMLYVEEAIKHWHKLIIL